MSKSTQHLRETTFATTLQVDREAGVIRGVKIIGRQSRNGRIYSDRALEQAAKLYEGAGVNIDHPMEQAGESNRKLADGFGHLRNIDHKDDGVYGDLVYLKSHALADQVCEAAERMPRQLGLSHNAEGYVTRRDQNWIVEGITRVHSVDLVRSPATNRGLFESAGATVGDSREAIAQSHESAAEETSPQVENLPTTIREILADGADDDAVKLDRIRRLMAGDESSAGTQILSNAVHSITLQTLSESVERLERRLLARELIDEAGLLSSSRLMTALLEAESDEQMREIIESWPRRDNAWSSDELWSRRDRPRSRSPEGNSRSRSTIPVDLNDRRAVAEFLRN